MSVAIIISLGVLFFHIDISIFFIFFNIYIILANKEKLRKDSEITDDREIASESQYLVCDDSQKKDDQAETENKARLFFLIRAFISLNFVMSFFYFGIILLLGLDITRNFFAAHITYFWLYFALLILSILFLFTYMFLDLFFPIIKQIQYYQKKSQVFDQESFKFSYLVNYLRRTKTRAIFSLIFIISSILLFISSQVLIWGFIVL